MIDCDADSQCHSAGRAHPGMGASRQGAVSLGTIGDGQERPRRGARAPAHRPGQKCRLVHPRAPCGLLRRNRADDSLNKAIARLIPADLSPDFDARDLDVAQPGYRLVAVSGSPSARPTAPHVLSAKSVPESVYAVASGDASFDTWTEGRLLPFLGTNAGAHPLAFQAWHRFKEAFPPELVRLAVREHATSVESCLDPFGGSGTTALAAQFLGIASTTVEVNPFLADVIRSKLCRYDTDNLTRAFTTVCRSAKRMQLDPRELFAGLPATFIEPGVDTRWLFGTEVAARLGALLCAIDDLDDHDHRRFFRTIVGGLLIDVSNVVVNGKGRRYRRNWQARDIPARRVSEEFASRATAAIADVHRFARRAWPPATVADGDARSDIPNGLHDLAVFSPPYPNSFDYTDVYNVELWMLGYLADGDDNRALRQSTLTSHVQLHRHYGTPPTESPLLNGTLSKLQAARHELWSPWIPEMVGAYFGDLDGVLQQVFARLRPSGACWIVIGDSRYAGVFVNSGQILAQLAEARGWSLRLATPFRSMRSSAQHGGRTELEETLLVLGNERSVIRRPRVPDTPSP